jgi:adenosylcobinamide-phosphate synthase
MRLATLVLALVWDEELGEPPAEWHPVVIMGNAARRQMGRATGDPASDLARGQNVAAGLPMAAAEAGRAMMRELRREGPAAELIGGAFLLKSAFAVRSMAEHADAVSLELRRGDLTGARRAVGMMVSRDVSKLDAEGVANTCIGSVAENVTDSVTAPLLAYAAAGVPGALAYRAINMMDAMYGYHGENEYLGKAAAKLDDEANSVPARVAGECVVAAARALGMDSAAAERTMREQHARTPSPNSGWPIGAAAGALGIEIEKVGYYRVGTEGSRAKPEDIGRALKLYRGAAVFSALLAAAMIVESARRR